MRELQEQHTRNAEILSKPYVSNYSHNPNLIALKADKHGLNPNCHYRAPSTSTYVQRLSAEQTAIEARLVELGVDTIKDMMQETTITDPQEREDNEMKTDDRPSSPSVPKGRAIDTKRRILARYVSPSLYALYHFSFLLRVLYM